MIKARLPLTTAAGKACKGLRAKYSSVEDFLLKEYQANDKNGTEDGDTHSF